jgi:glycosyltransferase involved in cell wall biosynthesis
MRCPNLAELPQPAIEKRGWPWTEKSRGVPDLMPNGKPFPRISIVTPSYNQGAFLEETIRSVLLQGYPDLEYIVIDGGSTDESVEIIRKYERWLTYWISEPDQGQSDAINKGWRRCTGDMIAWLNSDDYYAPNALEHVAGVFVSNASPDLVYGEISIADSQRTCAMSFKYRANRERMLAELAMPPQPASFFQRATVRSVGWLDPSLRYVMDFALMLKVLANATHIVYVPSVLAVFRYHPTSKTTTSEVKFATELLNVLENVLADWNHYPALHVLGAARVQSAFYRVTSKHLYLGGCFRESLQYIYRACRIYPRAILSILCDEGVHWLARWLFPIKWYRALGGILRASSLRPS